jgi:hypothetical protein
MGAGAASETAAMTARRRCMLMNLSHSKTKRGSPRALPRTDFERREDQIRRTSGGRIDTAGQAAKGTEAEGATVKTAGTAEACVFDANRRTLTKRARGLAQHDVPLARTTVRLADAQHACW